LLTHNHCENIFSSFWESANFDVQNAYLYGQIRCVSANARSRDSNRQYTYIYYVKGANGEDVRICREAFLAVHGLQNNRGRLGNIQTAIARGEPLRPDGRGKHSSRPNKHLDEHTLRVKAHIESFPKHQSHYSRQQNMNRVYVGSELSIGKMYDLYKEKCAAENYSAVSADYYRRVNCEEYNIGFAAPKSDTCKTCDKFENDLKSAEPESVEQLRSDYAYHKGCASKAF